MNHSDREQPKTDDDSFGNDRTAKSDSASGTGADEAADFALGATDRKTDAADLQETMDAGDADQDSHDLSVDAPVSEFHKGGTVPSAPEDTRLSEVASYEFPGFRLIGELGRGTFGVVYEALDVKLERRVAIKVPLLRNPALAHKYVEEARNAARIDAIGIVPVYHVGTSPTGQPFVVQKLIEGQTLKQFLASGKLGLMRALDILRRLAVAIHTAHQSGLVHRDLKPDNVLIDRQGQPWVADFGLAVFEDDQGSRRGEIAGTPRYMAPEQIEGRSDWLDGRCDIWALGVMLYEMVVGRPPFEGQTLADLQEQILHRDPRPISQRVEGAPSELDDIFRKCCAKQVSERYPNASDLAADLAAVMIDPTLLARHADSDLGSTIDVIDSVQYGATTIRTRRAAAKFPPAAWYTHWPWVVAIGAMGLASVAIYLAVHQASRGTPTASHRPTAESPSMPTESDPHAAAPPGTPPSQSPLPTPITVNRADGPLRTIEAGLQQVADGGLIHVLPGVYRENLRIERDVTLIGLGGRDSIRLLGGSQPALRIAGGSEIHLENITIESDDDQVNTIELVDGRLTVQSSRVRSWGYDCIKAHPGTSLVVVSSDFESDRHPAVVAKQAQVEVRGSTFRFATPKAGIDPADPVTAIELTECGGTLIDCTFVGIDRIGKGLSCRDTDDLVLVRNCAFTGLQHGIELFRCSSFAMEGGTKISGCDVGLYAETSIGSWSDAHITGCDIGSTLRENSRAVLANVIFRENSEVGLWVRDSGVEAEQCRVIDHPTVGWLVDSLDGHPPTIARGVEFQSNAIGILLVRGRVEMVQGRVSQNRSAGVAIVSSDQLSPAFARSTTENANPPTLIARQTTFNARLAAPAVLFNAPGRYRLQDCTLVDLPNHHRPALAPHLTTRADSDWVLVAPRP